MDNIVSLCKRRGFVFPSSEIYGGYSASYDYGPLGVLLKENIKKQWWNMLIQQQNIVGMDGAIFSHPKTWEASGHVESFTDPLVEDKVTHERLRADHLIEDYCDKEGVSDTELAKQYLGESKTLSELTISEMATIIKKAGLKSLNGNEVSEPKSFNLLVEALLGSTDQTKQKAYLRGETCQVIFLQYKNIMTSMRKKIPFGIIQMGKAFRNEITTKQFIMRTREFEQMEFEYFVDPNNSYEAYERWEDFFVNEFLVKRLGIRKTDIRLRELPEAERSHYAKIQKDFEIQLASGKWQEVSPMNHRGDWDLSRHAEYSGKEFTYEREDGTSFIPNVIETSFGVDRLVYAVLEKNYKEEKLEDGTTRTVLSLPFRIAPIKVAVFPLVKNKQNIVAKAQSVFDSIAKEHMAEFDDNGNVGKRYRRQDEIGTPFCITVDYTTLEDNTVTIRHRDSMKQDRIKIETVLEFINNNSLI